MARILMVDDDEASRLTLGAILEAEGHEIAECGSLEEARETVEAEHYDLVLLDRALPDGLGTDLAAELRQQIPGAKLILVTGTDADSVDRAHVDDVLTKGEDVMGLLEAIKRQL